MDSQQGYIDLRNRYLPKKIRVVFILESPPAHGGYFYDPTGRPSELLFRSFTQCLLDKKFLSKDSGLQALADAGYVFVNPIYSPVDKLSDKEADVLIEDNYPHFLSDLHTITGGSTPPLILIKKNICRILEPLLVQDGYQVLNKGRMIPFPMHYHYKLFEMLVRECLKELPMN